MKKYSFFTVIVASALFFACAPKQEQSVANKLHLPSMSKKEIKPGASVSLESTAIININANQRTDIKLALKTPVSSGTMHVDVIPGDGLQVLNAPTTYDVTLDGSASYPYKADVFAPNNGRFYLNLHVTLDNAEVISSRSLAAIIQVGPIAEESLQSSKLLKTSSGENIISLPAEETVTHQ